MANHKPTLYKYIIELTDYDHPRGIDDRLSMLRFFAQTLVSVTDCQSSQHVYGSTYYRRGEYAPKDHPHHVTREQLADWAFSDRADVPPALDMERWKLEICS